MIGRFSVLLSCSAALLLFPALTGCHEGETARSYYALDPVRPDPALPPGRLAQLEVRRFSVDSQFASRALVYRRSGSEYQLDHYHEMIVSPAQMITEKARTWLSQSGLFARVLDPGNLSLPTHSLEGNVTALYGDFRDKSAPAGVVELRVFLIRHGSSGDAIQMGKTYRTRVSLDTPDARGLVDAYNRCFVRVLTLLEEDLKAALLGTVNS